MICTKCGREVIGEKCIFCGTLLKETESDEKGTKKIKKNKLFKYAGIRKNMKLNKNGIVLFKGRQEGKESDAYIPYKNIIQVKFIKASPLKNGFITFCTKTGGGNSIASAKKAASDKQSIVFRKRKNEEFASFMDSFDTYMKKANPQYAGLITEEVIGQEQEQKKEIKQRLAQYDKEGVIYCPKCFSTNVNGYKKDTSGANTRAKCRNCGNDWHIAKKR